MMCTLQNNRAFAKFIFAFLLLNSSACVRKDPAEKYNKEFMYRHGREVKRAREKHRKQTETDKADYIQKRQKQQVETKKGTEVSKSSDKDFNYDVLGNREFVYDVPEQASVEKEYYREKGIIYEIEQKTELDYLNENYSVYDTNTINFDEIKIPRRDIFSNKDLGEKSFDFVNNRNMQDSFDYMYVIQRKREKALMKVQAKQAKIKAQKETKAPTETEEVEGKSILGKAKETVKGFTEKVRDLLK